MYSILFKHQHVMIESHVTIKKHNRHQLPKYYTPFHYSQMIFIQYFFLTRVYVDLPTTNENFDSNISTYTGVLQYLNFHLDSNDENRIFKTRS